LLFWAYTAASVVEAFVITSVSFVALSLWSYFTKRDLSGSAPWLFAGLIGILCAGLLNLWFASSVLQLVINCLAVVIFLGFTAYDTQQIREELSNSGGVSVEVLGALNLYLDFINLFVNLLQIIGVAPGSDD
jgi:FtsH-binding integral membrane protein